MHRRIPSPHGVASLARGALESWRWQASILRVVCFFLLATRVMAGDVIPTNSTSWWSFQPVRTPQIPSPQNQRWCRTPIDSFILNRLEAVHLKPAPTADKFTLLRRATFDLVGLPPTSAEVRAFLTDTSPAAFSNLVERLLASPRYGERWGRHWLDVARYADTAGDNADYPVPEASRYRDYVIDSFNQDKPYDQFVQEQLAGDVLAKDGPADRYAERIVATGFLALSRRYATAPFELMHLTIEDAIDTTSRTFLGLSMRCARCHDHKFDPLTKQDYYGMYGLFASTRFPYAGSEEFQSKNLPRMGFVPLLPPGSAARPLELNRVRLETLRAELARLEKEIAAGNTNAQSRDHLEVELKVLRTELKRRERSGALPNLPVAYAVVDDKPVDQFIHEKGEPSQPGPIVPRCLPAVFGQGASLHIAPGTSGRREFADWVTQAGNPLTARVMVNRLWHHHFGKGLVSTPSNLGMRSEPPSHPELLDYLAFSFVQHGWSIKAMHRLILNSAVWQQASAESESSVAKDPGNVWYSRFDRRRLDAEALRDSILAVSGLLDTNRPGPHPFPPIEEWHWTQHNPFKTVYESRHRSVYLMRQRLQRHPYLGLFDAPDANLSTDVRTASTVPLQALYFMNSPFIAEAAQAWAQQLPVGVDGEAARIESTIEQAWCRRPHSGEVKRMREFLRTCREAGRMAGLTADQAEREAWTSYVRVVLNSSEFVYVD
ncbi:MAG: DUF1553 domain-containing protein [Verrucomicrobiales bacterium]|nr:DUF1553 domain-containing protein [Verrucomicrobiales bacterium]